MALALKFMLCACLFAYCSEINGSPNPETVTRARCYANCVTSNTGNTDQDKMCQKKSCQECLVPCKERFATEQECVQKCSNSSSCITSCMFVSQVKNFNGDGSMPPKPGIAIVNSTDFSSISLQWSPVTGSTGTPVYLIGMTYSGDQTRSTPIYFDEVYVASQATLKFAHLCRFIRSAPIRSTFNGIFYKFRLAVLTENSSVSYGPETEPISLRKPDSVNNVTLENVQYDGSNSGDKLKITFSWTPSERQKHLVTKFAVVWDEQCHEVLPRPWETKGPQPLLSVYVFHKLKKCSHTLEVYAMINCSVSDPAKLKYQYSGCINVTDYPKDICYDFDPPQVPLEDRTVTNVTYGEIIANDDYKFSMVLNWNPPVYPYKKVERYFIRWGEVNPGSNWVPRGGRAPQDPHVLLKDLLPGKTYLVKIQPVFVHNQPTSGSKDFSFTTPAVPPDEVRVRSLKSGKFMFLPQAEIFTLNISWQKPSFNYSKLSSYTVFYQIGPEKTVLGTNQTHFDISGISHGEPITFKVTPKYEHDWINGSSAVGSDKAPVPQDDEVKVQNLFCGDFEPDGESGIFIVNVSWIEPRFNFSLNMYALEYELSGYSDRTKVKQNTNGTRILISRVRPKEILTFKVLPHYKNQFIQGLESTCVKPAPEPNATLLMVQNLRYETSENSNQISFNYNVSWEKPLFEYSTVASYTVLNRRKGNPEREKESTFTLMKNGFIAQDLIPGDLLDVEVIPVFAASVITGLKSATTIKPPGPSDEQNEVRNLNLALFVEDEKENTYYVNFTWQSPSFQFSSVKHYNVFYEFSGYTQDRLQCASLARKRNGCSQTDLKTPSIEISGILPRETVSLEVTPVYNNIHIIGRMANKRGTAPEPREQLVTVVGLQHNKLDSSYNNTFRTTVTWKKPLFTYSDVKHYRYKTYVVSDVITEKKRRQVAEPGLKTTDTNVTVDGINADSDIAFEVTPVFVESVVNGRPAVISLSRKNVEGNPSAAKSLSPAEVGGLVGGMLSFLLILIGGVIWCCRERHRQMDAKGLVSGKNAFMIDQWEVDGDLVSLEEELGEGAFGKVYKGFLRELPKPSRKLSLMPPVASTRRSTIKSSEGFTVAVKMLHGMADSEQRREFLEEIQLMKAVGSHKNIVNMIGCCTVEEPMFLLVEYIPYGDLLHYLRKRRGKVKEYLGDESRGPYRSTYCETYMIDREPGRVTLQMPRDDHIYANTPFAPKGDDGNIQLLSFNNTKKGGEIGTDNTGLTKDETDGEEEEDENEETLSPGDLMAFAWQISQGMEYLARKGFVHRDLAARNILVGDNKIAKVADFGLTRHVYEEKVYHAKRNRKLPLKWMSIEAIFDQTFTTQSDVWAFGVVLWELVTLGGTPYPTINNRELLRLLRDGYRMEKPDICNDDIYDLMIDCWKDIPEERPTFTQIREKLEEMMQRDNPYLDFSVLDETREYYNVPSFNSLQDETTDDELFERDNEDLSVKNSEKITSYTGEHKPPEDANSNETSTHTEGVMFLEKEGRTENLDLGIGGFNNSTYQGTNSNDDLKNVKINVDELEMSLYRPRHRGLVL